MRKFFGVCQSKFFGLSAGLGAALLCGQAFAEETTTTPAERLTTALSGVGFDSIITGISDNVLPWISAALGVAIAFWVVRLAWRKIKGVF